ncbi:hypothetical protein H311_03829, partial [Anncaliia algerae PRA109]
VINSLFINYLQGNKVATRRCDSLNSKRKYLATIENDNTKTFNFTITPEGSDIKIGITIKELKSIEDPNLCDWVNEFRELSAANSWTDKTSMLILKSITDKTLWHYFSSKATCDTCLDALISAQYPPRKRYFYEEELCKIKQKNYYLINEYLNEIKSIFNKYCLCIEMKPKEQNKRFEEYFYKGLDDITKLEMEKLGLYAIEDIISKIQSMESLLLNQSEKRQNSMEKLGSLFNQLSIKDSKKYCKYHRSTKHDDKECNKQKQINHKKDNNMHIIEKRPTIESLKTFIQVNGQETEAILDSGATSNYISSDTLKEINKHSERQELYEKCEVGDGREVDIIGKVSLNFYLTEFKNILCTEDFKIIKGKFSNIILGNKFLSNHKVKIDYENMNISIYNSCKDISDNRYRAWIESPDNSINEKFMNFTDSHVQATAKLNQIIGNYQETNPILGEIPNEEFRI